MQECAGLCRARGGRAAWAMHYGGWQRRAAAQTEQSAQVGRADLQLREVLQQRPRERPLAELRRDRQQRLERRLAQERVGLRQALAELREDGALDGGLRQRGSVIRDVVEQRGADALVGRGEEAREHGDDARPELLLRQHLADLHRGRPRQATSLNRSGGVGRQWV